MAKEEKKSPKAEAGAEIERFVKQSNLVIKRAGTKASVRGEFVFRTLRYELSGNLDLAARHIEP